MFGTGLYFIMERRDRVAALCLLVVGLIGMGLTVYQHYYNIKLVSPNALAWIGLGITWAFLIYVVSASSRRTPTDAIPFYDDRKWLNVGTGGLHQELDGLREGLVMWPGGVTTIAFPPNTFGHVARMILLDPDNSASVTEYCKLFTGSDHNVVSTVREVTRRAQNAGVKVRWAQRVYLGAVINDPKGNGWARIEVLYPGLDSSLRSNFIVTKAERRDLF